MSDGEPAPPGLSSRMKERLGAGSSVRGEEERKRKKRDEPPRSHRREYKQRPDNRYNSHRESNRQFFLEILEISQYMRFPKTCGADVAVLNFQRRISYLNKHSKN